LSVLEAIARFRIVGDVTRLTCLALSFLSLIPGHNTQPHHGTHLSITHNRTLTPAPSPPAARSSTQASGLPATARAPPSSKLRARSRAAPLAEPATDKQASFLTKLAADTGADVDPAHLSKAEASEKIDELKHAGAAASASAPAGDAAATAAPVRTSRLFRVSPDSHAGQSKDEPAIAPPTEWATGADPATQKQKASIAVMEKRAGEGAHDVAGLSKADASERIQELKTQTGL
jgi:hypothetical protein